MHHPVALEAAVLAPERLRRPVLEMPVLEGGYVAAMFVLPPVLLAIRGGARVLRSLGALARRVPGGATGARRLAPLPGRARTRTPPPTCSTACSTDVPRRRARSAITTPALVIAHTLDPLHAFADSEAVVRDLPNARLVRARTFLEIRFAPGRLSAEVADFLDEVWSQRSEGPGGRGAARGASA
ncbi:MAG: hypothetical protein H0V55_02805 [Thermoleophilaceae bacterium]|jgi:pimeloyl-ACP methyl ester carboxylesterase|nr:hypothetical protein [Thermoleophilaceae bacterium]